MTDYYNNYYGTTPLWEQSPSWCEQYYASTRLLIGEEEEKNEKRDNLKHFSEAFGKISKKLIKILKKKHSERTEEEKERIRKMLRKDKPEIPKIEIQRMVEEPWQQDITEEESELLQTLQLQYNQQQIIDSFFNKATYYYETY